MILNRNHQTDRTVVAYNTLPFHNLKKRTVTIFSLVFIFLVLIGINIWIRVPPEAVRVEGDLKPPRVMKRVEPVYPEKARKAGIRAEIILEVKTDLHGNVKSAEVINIDPSHELGSEMWMLYEAARDAVLLWRFEPFNYKGRIRSAIFTVTVKFE